MIAPYRLWPSLEMTSLAIRSTSLVANEGGLVGAGVVVVKGAEEAGAV